MFISAIKEGINTVHRNWHLVIIQFVSLLLSCIAFFVVVGIPIAFAFIMLGLDLTEILRFNDFLSAFKGSADLLSKYLGMAIIVILSLFLYLAFIIILWIFTISGTIGTLKNSILTSDYRFSLKSFFIEGKRFFFPVFFFSVTVGIIFIILAFMLGLLGSAASTITEIAKTQEATLALFLGVFFSLIIISAGLFLIIVTLSTAVYGIAYLAFNISRQPFETLKETIRYLYSTPSSISFYAILFLGYIATGFLIILIGSPFTLIPIIGPILSLPYQVVTYIIQGYVNLIMLSSVFHYYYRTGYSVMSPESIADSDTSQKGDAEQLLLHEEIDETQKG